MTKTKQARPRGSAAGPRARPPSKPTATPGRPTEPSTGVPRWAWWTGREVPEVNPRHAARILEEAGELELLACGGGQPLDAAVQRYQRARRKMGRNDRALLAEAVFGLARNRDSLRAALPGAQPGRGQLLMLALLDTLDLRRPGKVPHLPGGVREWLAALDRLERLRREWLLLMRRFAKASPTAIPPEARSAWEGLTSTPFWWLGAGPWATLAEALREIATLRRRQSLTLRAQAHRTGRTEVRRELAALGVPTRVTPRSPWGLVVAGRHNVLATAPYREGRVEVQDEGSQLAACLCDPKPGERVLDLCAGGGGKTLALAATMEGRGTVVAHDRDSRRLQDTRRRARRAGLGNVVLEPDPGGLEARGPYDLVLVDAPCSSTGTLRRNPDVAWRWQPDDLNRLVQLQAEILDLATGLVAPGGRLVYVTCSLLQPENRGQVTAFLARNEGFALTPVGSRRGHAPLLDVPGAETGCLRLPANLPRYSGDAFFMACLSRTP